MKPFSWRVGCLSTGSRVAGTAGHFLAGCCLSSAAPLRTAWQTTAPRQKRACLARQALHANSPAGLPRVVRGQVETIRCPSQIRMRYLRTPRPFRLEMGVLSANSLSSFLSNNKLASVVYTVVVIHLPIACSTNSLIRSWFSCSGSSELIISKRPPLVEFATIR